MKKLFTIVVALVLTSTLASAQQINLWKNGKCIGCPVRCTNFSSLS